mmetsp:Transcript_12760/g.34293  ORF Transcript_12760/g.34293 Transcript_12760/m.34293 type:complete len:681 (+) Transcript_12760:42-2084(+)
MAARVGKYLLFETLGEGAFGKVKLGVHEDTGEQVAVKCMDKADIKAQEMTMNVRREIAIMKALKHKNIVNMLQVLSSSSKLYIVMELVTGGELFTKILNEGKLPEDLARRYFQNVVDGVDYCHLRGVCHRDLKPENLLIEDTTGELKITDFGLSAMRGTATAEELHLLHTQCGSPNYCAPEIITSAKKGYNGVMVDIWSCGIILFALLAGYLPFYDENTRNLYKMIQNDPVRYPKKFPPGAKDLCERLLTKSPDRRITMSEVKQHPWFVQGYTGDGVLKGGIQPISAPGEKKALAPPSAGDGGAEDDGDSDEEAKLKTEMLKMAISKRTLALEDEQQQKKKAERAGQGTDLHPNSARVHELASRYKKLFELDESGRLMRSSSFKQTKGSPGSVVRAKNIAAATYMSFREQIHAEEDGMKMDSSEVSDGTVQAFANLLDFFESKKNAKDGEREWWNAIPPLSEEEADIIEGLCQLLEPNNVDDKVEDVGDDKDSGAVSSNGAPPPTSPMREESGAPASVAASVSSGAPLVSPKPVSAPRASSPPTAAKAAAPPAAPIVANAPAAVALQSASKRQSGFARILGIAAVTSFETELAPERALREVGKILTVEGFQVMMKRGDQTKMKFDLGVGSGEKMLVAVTSEKKGAKTSVTFKRIGGKNDTKMLEEFFQELLVKFNRNVKK